MSQRHFPPIQETAEDLRAKLRQARDATARDRVHLLLLIATAEVKSRVAAARHLKVHRNTVRNWLEAYKRGGLVELLEIKPTGPAPEQRTLPPAVYEALQERLKGEGFLGYTTAQEWLRTDYGLHVPYRTVHGLIRERLGGKLKRARPRHQKKRQ